MDIGKEKPAITIEPVEEPGKAPKELPAPEPERELIPA